MSIIQEFKSFAVKGNVVDLAVGVVVGGAFGKIVTSLVNDLLMPPIGKIMGGVNFADLFVNLDPGKRQPNGDPLHSLAQAKAAGAAVIAYGQFLSTVLDFLIISFCVFLLVKGFNRLRDLTEQAKTAEPSQPIEPPADVKLLTEIRDLLAQGKTTAPK